MPQRTETEPNQETSPISQTCTTPVTQLPTPGGEKKKSAKKRAAVNEGASTSRQSDDSSPEKMKKIPLAYDLNLSKERPAAEVREASSRSPLSEDAKSFQEMAGPACFKINRAIKLLSKKDEQIKEQTEEVSRLKKMFQNKVTENSMQNEKLEYLTEETSMQKKKLLQMSEEKAKLEEKLKQIKKLYSAVKMVLAV
ncbi:hypothetical protein HDE_02424 [Halotydeus destructor]|nr:hypothetical protein HDE_02424 [Halotydeus destructor]